MNQVVRKTFLPGWRSVWWGIPDMCRDHRHRTACQKQYNQNEPPGQVDVPARVEVCVKGDLRHVYGPETFHSLSKTIQTVWTSWLGRCSSQGGGLSEISTPVETLNPKAVSFCLCCFWQVERLWWDIFGPYTCPESTITQTSTQVAMSTQPAGSFCLCFFWQAVRHLWWRIPDMCRDHRCLTACQKKHRQNEPAGWVDIATWVEVCMTVDPGHM